MRLPIKPIIRKKVRSNGTTPIFLQYCYTADHKTLLNTTIAIPPMYWDKKKQCIKDDLPQEFGPAEKLNDEIDRQYALACELVKLAKRQGVELMGAYVKEKFSPSLKLSQLALEDFQMKPAYVPVSKMKKEGFFKQLDDYALIKAKKVANGTLQVIHSMIHHFEAFEIHRKKKITFTCFDYTFYEDFIDFLTFEYQLSRKKIPVYGLRLNTIGKTIKQFRIFIRDRVKRKIIPAIDLSDYKILEEESDAVYLTHDEIGRIYHTDLKDYPALIPHRNLFVLGCLTGLRFSDFSTLKPEDLQQDMLYKKQEKTTHWVVIPLRKEAKEIFTEQFKYQVDAIANGKFNENIKTIAKLAGIEQSVKFSYKKGNKIIEIKKPKYAWITSHTARRSFCTNEFLAGTPVLLIMKISGHKREKDFYRYIRITPQEAAEQIKKLWIERQDMQAFKTSRSSSL